MSIIRAPRPDSNFYMLNKSISEDKSLGWAARGLLVYLLGKPDHWSVNIQALVNEVSESGEKSGRDRTYAIINQLLDAGYITRQQGQKESGKFLKMNYLVSETPFRPLPDKPDTVKPDTAEPHTVEPTLVSNDVKQGLNGARTENPGAPVSGKKRSSFDPMQAKPENVTEQAWSEWVQHRKEIRKPLTATSCAQQTKKLAGVADADSVIRESIANGWTGLFPEPRGKATTQKGSRHHGLDDLDYGSGSDENVIIGGF